MAELYLLVSSSNALNFLLTAAAVAMWMYAIVCHRCRSFSAIIAFDFVAMTFIIYCIKPLIELDPNVYWRLIYALKHGITIILLLMLVNGQGVLRLVAALAAAVAMLAEASFYVQYFLHVNDYMKIGSMYYIQPHYFPVMLTISLVQLATVGWGLFDGNRWVTGRRDAADHDVSYRYFRSRKNLAR